MEVLPHISASKQFQNISASQPNVILKWLLTPEAAQKNETHKQLQILQTPVTSGRWDKTNTNQTP